MKRIPIVIPAYEPDDRMLVLLRNLMERDMFVVLVDDGSGEKYADIFREAECLLGGSGVLLSYGANQGKGHALKIGFNFVIRHIPLAVGVVTADSDGQHTPQDIQKVQNYLMEHPLTLVLGGRSFRQDGIPWKSRWGNRITEKVFYGLSGIHVRDTQTGLRGIPLAFMKEELCRRGERFEFEMRMLLDCVGRYEIMEIPIETVYESADCHRTHFRSVRDSVRIYSVLGVKFIKYLFSSLSSATLDLLLFTVFCSALRRCAWSVGEDSYIIASVVMARLLSVLYNYGMNYRVVFKSNAPVQKSALKYAALALVQMALSAAMTVLFYRMASGLSETICKAIADTILFFISYQIQLRYVFKNK